MPPILFPPPPSPIRGRVTNPRYKVGDTSSDRPDRIIEHNDSQYLCFKFPLSSTSNPYTRAKCWKVIQVKTQEASLKLDGVDTICSMTTILYPYGQDCYNFEVSDVLNYTYQEKY